MDTSLNNNSVEPDVDYEQSTEDDIKEDKPQMDKERKEDRVEVSEYRAKGKDARPNITSLLAGRALMEPGGREKAHYDAETCFVRGRKGHFVNDCYQHHKIAAFEEVDDDDTSKSESGKE
ncbi:hypothetical protein E4U56_001360 [Claviceps arundinis]|uniref:Uncharacterized protein n=1 Tax=Claviceps arundinis TaxID=1623583 RepID=A0A9P7SNK4_9HYPO|nr:hypothetical protein E4U56_001360 [Claviceps arundinis]